MDNDQKLFEYQPLISVSSGNLQRERERDGATKRDGSDSEDSFGCRSGRRGMLGSEAKTVTFYELEMLEDCHKVA